MSETITPRTVLLVFLAYGLFQEANGFLNLLTGTTIANLVLSVNSAFLLIYLLGIIGALVGKKEAILGGGLMAITNVYYLVLAFFAGITPHLIGIVLFFIQLVMLFFVYRVYIKGAEFSGGPKPPTQESQK